MLPRRRFLAASAAALAAPGIARAQNSRLLKFIHNAVGRSRCWPR